MFARRVSCRPVRGCVPSRARTPHFARAPPQRSRSTESAQDAPDHARTFRAALSELLRHDAQAALPDGSSLLTPSNRPPKLSKPLLHELIPLHESLLRRICQVPVWHLYSKDKGATMFPIKPTDPHGAVTIPLFSSRPMALPHAQASEIMEMSLAALIGNLATVRKHAPRLKSLSLEPRGLDFQKCLHLEVASLESDLSTIATALQFEETLTHENPALPRALPLWTWQHGSTLFSSILGPDFAAPTAPDPLLDRLVTVQKLETAPDVSKLSQLGPHTHAFTFEGRAIEFGYKHKLWNTHRLIVLPAEILFTESKEQKKKGVYVHISNGGVAMKLA